jgi:hypothetical protein
MFKSDPSWRLQSLVILACLLLHQAALAWGPQGHRAVATLAEQLLPTDVRTRIERLLASGPDRDLASVSTWADDVREASRGRGVLVGDPEAGSFNQRFPNNYLWHFVDLPLGSTSYRAVPRFVSNDDVVRTIERCIRVLESPSGSPDEFNELQALRLLVHFVADIHQPLHCVSGYYRLSELHPPELVFDPVQAIGLPSDRGGNELFFDPQHQLHAFWDSAIVEQIAGTKSPDELARFLKNTVSRNPTLEPAADYHTWPEIWALDSVAAARQVYAGISFRAGELNDDQRSARLWIRLPGDYPIRAKEIAAQQLAKAAQRLAQLLSKIQFAAR